MDDEAFEEKFIVVSLKAHANNEVDALMAVETFSRLMIGLALDGLNVSLDVFVVEDEDELYEEIDSEGESDTEI